MEGNDPRAERKSRLAREKTYYPTLAMLKKRHGKLMAPNSVFDVYETPIGRQARWSVVNASLRVPASYEKLKEDAEESFTELINRYGERPFQVIFLFPYKRRCTFNS